MKYCSSCGAVLSDDAAFCSKCGARFTQTSVQQAHVPPAPQYPYQAPAPSVIVNTVHAVQPQEPDTRNGLGVACFVLSLIGLVFSWIPIVHIVAVILAGIGFCLGIPGLIVGIVKKKNIALDIVGLLLAVAAVVCAYAVVEYLF